MVVELLGWVVDECSHNGGERNKASCSDPHISETLDISVQDGNDSRVDDFRSDVGNELQGCGVVRGEGADEGWEVIRRDTLRDDNLGNVGGHLHHLISEQGVVDGDTDCATQRSDADDETAGNGDELRGDAQLSDSDKSGQGHAQGHSQEDGVPPDGVVCVAIAGGHADEKGDEDQESKDRDPPHLAGHGAVETSNGGTDNGADEHDAVSSTNNQCVGLVEHADLEIEIDQYGGSQCRSSDPSSTYLKRKVGVGCEESNTFSEDTEESEGEVAVLGEEAVVEHAILLEPCLIDHETNGECEANSKSCGNVGVGPWVRGVRPREADAEEDQAGCEEEVSDPVELLQLLQGLARELLLLLSGGRVVSNRGEKSTKDVESHGHEEIVAEAVGSGVVGAVERAADEKTGDCAETVGDHVGGLAPSSPSSREDFGRDGVQERLDAKSNAGDCEAGNGHVHAGGSRDNDGANGAEEGEADEEPFSSPVVGGLGDHGTEDDGQDGDGRGEPDSVGGAIEVAGNGLALLLFIVLADNCPCISIITFLLVMVRGGVLS